MYINIILLDFQSFFGCPWWWLASLGAFLLGCLLCRLFSSSKKEEVVAAPMAATNTAEIDALNTKFAAKEKDYISLKYQYDELSKDKLALEAALKECKDSIVPIPVGTAGGGSETNYAAILGEDNLQIVEGVGPKIEGLLKADGINTWADFGNASYDRLKGILDAAGPRYRIHDPKSWAQQAKLAADGKWDELIEFQKFLDGGRENKGDFGSPSKVEKLLAKKLGFSNNPNDLKIVEGIGPKIEGLLKDAGINTWSDLAAADVDKLQEILNAAGDRFKLANPGTWPKQAGLAAAGSWSELTEYQDFLDGGNAPK